MQIKLRPTVNTPEWKIHVDLYKLEYAMLPITVDLKQIP
jgi:hypothetical protein